MKNHLLMFAPAIFLIAFDSVALADDSLKADNEHARVWNKFADDVLALHKKLTSEIKHTVKKRVGGYFGQEKFYNEEAYYDKKNRLISRVQWERENPESMHTIEVFVRDKSGRVIRDYAAAYLPTFRNAPTQTLISFHAYNGKLHAFRTFDASGARIVERCTGKLGKQEVNMILDEDEIYEALDGESGRMEQPDYVACFKGIPEEAGQYVQPQ